MGMTAHKMAHEPDEKRWKCHKGCPDDVTFGSKKAQSNHYKYKHSDTTGVYL